MDHDMPQLVTAAAEILDLLDQVEKRKQHQQRGEHQRGGGGNLAREIAAQRPHLMKRNSENTISRRWNRSSSTANMTTCTPHKPVVRSTRDCAIEACTMDNRLL